MAMLNQLAIAVVMLTSLWSSAESRTLQKRMAAVDPNPNIKNLFSDIGGRQEVDLIVALDRSKSISEEVFYLKSMKLARAILQQYATLDTDYVRLAVQTFAVNTTTEFDYITNPDIAKTKCALFNDDNSKWNQISYKTNLPETNIKAAFQDALDIFADGKTRRPDAKQIIVLISDGKYTDANDPIEVSRQLKEGNRVTIYGVGIGAWLEIGNVRTLTTALDGNNDLYADYGEWVKKVTSGDTLSSFDTSLGQTWVRDYSESCSETCGDNAACYCDVDRGYDACLCKTGYFLNATSGSCTECPANTYKDTVGNFEQCTTCPPGTTSPGKARSKNECTCTEAQCTDPCDSATCGVNEICVATNATDYECQCQDGWTGTGCATNVDACAADPCKNNAICVDGVGSGVFACLCTTWGYIGRFCEINEDECEPGLCKNNATCDDRINNFQCQCEGEYVGRYCQDTEQQTPAPTPAPVPTPSTSTKSSSSSPSVTNEPVVADDKTFWIIIGASCGGGLLLLIIIIVVSVCVCRKKKNNDKSKEEVKNIARQFSGFWKKKTVRGNKWMDDEANGGLPSAPESHRPDLLNDATDGQGSVENLKTDEYTELPYHTMTLKTGMESWQNYITELEEGKMIERALVAKSSGDKVARTSAWLYDQEEVDKLAGIMDDQEEGVPLLIQESEYYISENDGTLATGKTIGDLQEAKVVCIGRTKTYVVVAVAGEGVAESKVRKEVQWIVDHISGEGY